MPLPHPVDATLHGVTDYTAASILMTALPRIAGVSGTRSGRQIRMAGAIHAGYSAITDYPLGVVKALPFRAHLAIDAAGAIALAAAPFVTGQYRRGTRHWLPHLALCLFELGSLALTDPTGRGDYKGDPARVRSANAMDPGRQIRGERRAVRPAAA